MIAAHQQAIFIQHQWPSTASSLPSSSTSLGQSHQLASGQEKLWASNKHTVVLGAHAQASNVTIQVRSQQLGCRQGPAPTLTRTHESPFQSAGPVGRGTRTRLSCGHRALGGFTSSVRGAGCTEAVRCKLLCRSCRMRSRLHA